MRNNMDESDLEEFDKFIERNWGDGSKKTSKKSETEEKVVAVWNRRGKE